jgi:hypothetical protein
LDGRNEQQETATPLPRTRCRSRAGVPQGGAVRLGARLLRRRPEVITADTPLDGGPQPSEIPKSGKLQWDEVVAGIDRALAILAARRAAGVTTLDVQLVIQACSPGTGYLRWRKERQRLFQRSNQTLTTEHWPDRLPHNQFALLLLPYPAGKVGPALAGTNLRASPMVFFPGVYDDPAWLDLMTAEIIRSWLHWTPEGMSVAVAPPVLEEFRVGHLHRRSLFDCGLSWPLPPPDGLASTG